MAAPEKLVINVLGDAAIGMCGMDLETAARERIPIMTVLLNNSAMGNYEKMQPVAVERFNIKRLSGDYAALARSLGVWSERVDDPAQIVPAIQRAQAVTADGRPALLEMITAEEPAEMRLP